MDAFPAAGEPYRTNLFLRYCQEFADKGCIEGFGSAFSRSSPNPNAEAFDGKKRYKCVLCTTRMDKDLPLEARGIPNPSNSGYSSMKTTLTHIFNCHPEIPWGWKLNLLGKEFEKNESMWALLQQLLIHNKIRNPTTQQAFSKSLLEGRATSPFLKYLGGRVLKSS